MNGGQFFPNPAGFPEKRDMGCFPEQCPGIAFFNKSGKQLTENGKESKCFANLSGKME